MVGSPGNEDADDADRLAHDPAMRRVVGDRGKKTAASAGQMGRFETEILTQGANLNALADLSGRWIDAVLARRPVRVIVLDMDSSVSPTCGDQESSGDNGHFGCGSGGPAELIRSRSKASGYCGTSRL